MNVIFDRTEVVSIPTSDDWSLIPLLSDKETKRTHRLAVNAPHIDRVVLKKKHLIHIFWITDKPVNFAQLMTGLRILDWISQLDKR